MEFIAGLLQVFHAVGLGEDAAFVKSVDVDFLARVLEAAKEVTG